MEETTNKQTTIEEGQYYFISMCLHILGPRWDFITFILNLNLTYQIYTSQQLRIAYSKYKSQIVPKEDEITYVLSSPSLHFLSRQQALHGQSPWSNSPSSAILVCSLTTVGENLLFSFPSIKNRISIKNRRFTDCC